MQNGDNCADAEWKTGIGDGDGDGIKNKRGPARKEQDPSSRDT